MKRMLIATLALVLALPPVLAQDGPDGEEKFDVEAALREVTELLGQSEKLLVESLRPKEEAAEGASTAGQEAKKAIDELLGGSRQSGEDAVAKMLEILEKAPSGSGSGGGQDAEEPKPGDEDKRKKDQQKPDGRDPQNQDKSGKPANPDESKDEKAGKDKTKPPSKTGKPGDPDPAKEWLATLPEQVRQAYLNKDWGRIPQRWRDYVEEYVKRLSELESTRRGE